MDSYTRAIRSLVKKIGLDYVSLGIEINASEKSIYKWLNGTSRPNCSHLLSLIALADKADNNKKPF